MATNEILVVFNLVVTLVFVIRQSRDKYLQLCLNQSNVLRVAYALSAVVVPLAGLAWAPFAYVATGSIILGALCYGVLYLTATGREMLQMQREVKQMLIDNMISG